MYLSGREQIEFGLLRWPVDMKSIAIIAGGTPPQVVMKADYTIGVDQGALWLIHHGVKPDLAIGDFDSVTKREKSELRAASKKILEYPPRKDATDLELAIDEAIKLRPTVVVMYGVLGSRFDHSIAAIQMLLRLESHNISGQIVDNFNKISVVRRQITLMKDRRYRYVSIIPIESNATVTLKGFVYDVIKKIFRTDSSLGISNEINDDFASITVHSGKAVIIQSADIPVIG